MPDPAAPNPLPTKPQKGPNFLLVVVFSGVAFVLFIAGALLILDHYGRDLLPHQRYHGTQAYLRQLQPQSALFPAERAA